VTALLARALAHGGLALALLSGCGGGGAAPAASANSGSGPALAPDFELPTLAGTRESLAAHRGKDVVLIDFWATFCEPCLLSLPELDALYRREKSRGFVVFGVAVDEAANVARVRSEASKLGLSFPVLLDADTRVISVYNPRATAPYSVLVARDGQILRRQEGYTTGERENLEKAVADAL
jgi:cytochrome c biogenesis protein CcmG/thiol:disulfide interchange protein DsbE